MMESVVHNPMVPYNSYIHGGFREGKFLRVQGRTNHDTFSLKINLMCGPSVALDDIAFHLDARFSENVIVRNAKNHSSWGIEERNGIPFPLARGESFEIMILCESHQFKIAVNGQHFTEFNHRVPLERITHVEIEGDIIVTLVQFEGGLGSITGTGYASPSAPVETLCNSESYQSPPGGYPPPTGFVLPPPLPNFNSQSGSAYPSNSAGGGYPPSYPPGPSYGYPPQGPAYGPPPPIGYGPGYGQPPPGPGYGGYPPPYGYPNQGYPQQGGSGSGGGIIGGAQKLLAGVGLAGVANKIPGLSGGGHGHSGHGYPGGGNVSGGQHGGGGLGAGGILGSAAALGVGGALAAKMMKPKKMKKNKLLKYGLPLAGVGVGGYALSKGMKGFGRRGSWSSSSSSSSE